jgi:hypothetical protein
MQTVTLDAHKGKAHIPEPSDAHRLSATRALALPLAFGAALAAFSLVPMASEHPRLRYSIYGAAAFIALGVAALFAKRRGRLLALEIQPRPQHYLQACAQSSVLLYWGWYWRPVYDALPLLAAQLAFAYAFDMLLAWSRRDTYALGFGPLPVIFSINLFLWFKPDWFYLQFLMIAIGFAAKELIRWEREGRRAHIFNPSSFPLAIVSIALIATGSTSMTYGPDIATTQFNPPYFYLLLFLIGLPGQYLFGVTTMTMSAVVTAYLCSLAYFAATGAYLFFDSYIPAAVFLGMHLLFTDPSTSPRTELGRILFGVSYGLGVVILNELLDQAGAPTFYDKLLPVPILNLSVRAIDRAVRSGWIRRFDPARLGRSLAPRRRHLAYMGVWTAIFVAMSSVGAVGNEHPGHRVPFWQQACVDNARHGCRNLALMLDTFCAEGSGWACNEVGVLRWHGRVSGKEGIQRSFLLACTLGFPVGCTNAAPLGMTSGPPRQAPPALRDYPIVLQTGKRVMKEKTPLELYTRACDQGWRTGCFDLAELYLAGKDAPRDSIKAIDAFRRACDLGHPNACKRLADIERKPANPANPVSWKSHEFPDLSRKLADSVKSERELSAGTGLLRQRVHTITTFYSKT